MTKITNTIPQEDLAKIYPIESMANGYLADANKIIITDNITLKTATTLKKNISSFLTASKESRLEWTEPYRNLVSAINAKAELVLEPAVTAKDLVTKLIVAHEAKIAEELAIEVKRVLTIVEVFIFSKVKPTIDENIEMKEKVTDYFNTLSEADQENPDIKQACFNLFALINSKILELQEEVARKEEAERLAKMQKEQDAVTIAQEQERQRLAKIQRDLDVEKRRLADIQINQALETERLEKAEEESKVKRVATGIRTYTKFKIIDANLIPREYCEPSDSLINQAIKQGVTVPGIETYQEKK